MLLIELYGLLNNFLSFTENRCPSFTSQLYRNDVNDILPQKFSKNHSQNATLDWHTHTMFSINSYPFLKHSDQELLDNKSFRTGD